MFGGDIMSSALDFAKFFIKKGLDTSRNTYDGNMKLQKLLFFANLVSLAENGNPLFNDPICAFSNGCVVESVRLRYKNDCSKLCEDSNVFDPDFSQEEYDVVNLTETLFGKLSARELSDINHTFDFWHNAYNRSIRNDGFKRKEQSEIKTEEMMLEISKIKTIINQFKENAVERAFKEVINGIDFYYQPEMEMNDDVLEVLEAFSREADEQAYSVYLEEGKLVIY